jgi:hypothetical protein
MGINNDAIELIRRSVSEATEIAFGPILAKKYILRLE